MIVSQLVSDVPRCTGNPLIARGKRPDRLSASAETVFFMRALLSREFHDVGGREGEEGRREGHRSFASLEDSERNVCLVILAKRISRASFQRSWRTLLSFDSRRNRATHTYIYISRAVNHKFVRSGNENLCRAIKCEIRHNNTNRIRDTIFRNFSLSRDTTF